MILNASAVKGASSATRRSSSSPVSGLWPIMGGTSSGDGRRSTTASSSGCTPLFLKAEPQVTGTIFMASVPARMAARISASEMASPFRYFSISDSSASAAPSSSFSRASAAAAAMSAGISSSR